MVMHTFMRVSHDKIEERNLSTPVHPFPIYSYHQESLESIRKKNPVILFLSSEQGVYNEENWEIQSRPENLKKSRQKKLAKSNKSFFREIAFMAV